MDTNKITPTDFISIVYFLQQPDFTLLNYSLRVLIINEVKGSAARIEFAQLVTNCSQLLITVQKTRVAKKGNGLQVNTNQQNISEGTSLQKLILQRNAYQSNIY